MTWALVLKYWREGLLLVGAALLLTAWHGHNTALVQLGQARERARVADSTIAATAKQLARVDTLIVRDVPRVIHAAARVDTLRDSVLTHLTDTLIVKQFVARTDTALAVCTDLANDCAQFRVLANQKIAALESKVNAIPALHSNHHIVSNILWGLLGVAVGYEAHRRP